MLHAGLLEMIPRHLSDDGQAQNWTTITRYLFAVSCLAIAAGSSLCFGSAYDEQRQRGLEACEAIDKSAYETGMWLNPDGYRSYYKRSACLQRLAIKMRDLSLCDQVHRRWALFSSSWGYSEANCIEQVNLGIAQDQQALSLIRQAYLGGPVALTDFRVELNGNGRDYDIVPSFSPGYSTGYHLSLWIVSAGRRYLLSESGFHLDGNENIRMFEYRQDILRRFESFKPGSLYTVEAALTLSTGTGSQSGLWSPEFIESVFPAVERTQILRRNVRF